MLVTRVIVRAATSGSHQGRLRPATAKLIMGLVSIAPHRWRGSAAGSPSGPSGAKDRRKAIRIADYRIADFAIYAYASLQTPERGRLAGSTFKFLLA